MKINSNKEDVSTTKVTFLYIFSSFLTSGIDIVLISIFSRLLSKAEFGKFSLFTTWEGLLLIIFSMQLVLTIPRAKYDFAEEMPRYVSTMACASSFFVLLGWIFTECNQAFVTQALGMDMRSIRFLAIDLIFAATFSLLQTEFRMYKKYKFFVFFSILFAFVRTAVSIILVLIISDRFMARLIGYVIPTAILNVILWVYVVWRGKGFRFRYFSYAFPIAFPLIFHGLASNILGTSDRIMISRICGDADAAMYTIASTCATIACILWTAMNNAWVPWMYDKLEEKKYNLIRNKIVIYFAMYGGAIIGILLIIPEMILLFGGYQYYEAIYVLPPILVGYFCQFIYGMYVNVELYLKKTPMVMLGTTLAAVVNVVLNLIFITQFGYIAAAYTTLIGYLVLTVFHFFVFWRYKEYRDVYPVKLFFWSIVGMGIYGVLCLWLYSHNIIRYLFIGIYVVCGLIIVYKNRNKLMLGLK